MKDMKFQELKAIMVYMYRGEVVIPHDQLTALLQAAESLQIKGLGCGDKQPTENVNKGLSQQRQIVIQPQMTQQPKQTIRQQLATRTPEPARDSGPQFVDLTEERVPSNAAKRSAQQSPGRYKRQAYSPGTTSLQPQNVAPVVNAGQMNVLRAALPAQNLPSPSVNPSVVAFPVNRPAFPLFRPVNETSAASFTPALQKTPSKVKDKRETKQNVVASKANVASLPPSHKRYVQGDQNPLPSQSSVAPDSGNSPLPSSEKNDLKYGLASDYYGDKQKSELTPSALAKIAPTAGNCPSEDEIRKSMEDNPEVDKTVPDINSSLCEPVPEQANESDLEKSNSEKKKGTSAAEGEPLNKQGPSGEGGSPGKQGRRRRAGPERRYSCPECGKKFSIKGYLEQHLRLHDGDAYQCDVCDKMFLSRPALIRHVRLHAAKSAPAVQHKCKLCGATFTSAADLENHLTEHTLAAENENKE